MQKTLSSNRSLNFKMRHFFDTLEANLIHRIAEIQLLCAGNFCQA